MKLLVCDDDISTIDVIQSQLDCKELGISKILRAYNGIMAREVIDKENPELILCDIGMPLSNGIDVLKYVYEKNPDIEFSFLTCYETFEYAQIAIKYGVTSYLTKPFDLEEVKVCIQKMIANVKKKKNETVIREQSQYDMLMSSVFRQASDGLLGNNREMVDAGLRFNGVDFTADSKWRIVFSCADMTDAIRKTWSRDLLLFTASRIHDEAILGYIGSAYTVVNSDERFVWSTCFVRGETDDETLKTKCEQLVEFGGKYMSLEPVVLISEPFEFYKASDVVANLYDQMRKLRYYGGKVFFENEELNLEQQSNAMNENQILWYLKKHDEEGYKEYLRSLLDSQKSNADSLDHFRKELVNVFVTYFRDNGMSSNNIFMDEKIIKLDEKAVTSKTAMMDYAIGLFEMQQNKLRELTDSEDIIARAKRFIDENYHENIDRNDVAAVAFVTPNYLSKLFKNSMNMNLREYINQLRVEEAKRLLLSTSMSVSEIASYVGYFNISYFSTIFHKIVGVSPFDWRNERAAD